ncbi:hypothetical protein N7V09_12865 [Shewanella seohaensis]|uniref:hypothetical protein n=1 Tax=Shewanella seohaensis TaxID=755175 RepID=UPI0021C9FF80|nr:hypothetical protein [Shewanella seohaensis]UXM80775.1 hypothetical protein N7V09_12865 [Shewanella seohaensis]
MAFAKHVPFGHHLSCDRMVIDCDINLAGKIRVGRLSGFLAYAVLIQMPLHFIAKALLGLNGYKNHVECLDETILDFAELSLNSII